MSDLPTPPERFDVPDTDSVHQKRLKAAIAEKMARIKRLEADRDELINCKVMTIDANIQMIEEEIKVLEKQFNTALKK
jgi:hypothetical protein